MTPSERLQAARLASHEGRFEEALAGFLWFHEHALEVQPSLRGVRLSFALSYWSELSAVYPKALRELERIRDREAAALLDGTGGQAAFRDLAAINRTLSLESQTYALFAKLASSHPATAASCASMALPSIVQARDYALAALFAPEPEAEVQALVDGLNKDVLRHRELPRTRAPRLKAYAYNFAAEVKLFCDLLAGLGRAEESSNLRQLALKGVHSSHVRRLVRSALAGDV